MANKTDNSDITLAFKEYRRVYKRQISGQVLQPLFDILVEARTFCKKSDHLLITMQEITNVMVLSKTSK